MTVRSKLDEGNAKILYTTENPAVLLTVFKDDATAFKAQKRSSIEGNGAFHCTIANHLFKQVEANGIATHFIQQTRAKARQGEAVWILPFAVDVRNIAVGNVCQQTGLSLASVLNKPLVEFYYKNDALGDPLLTLDHWLLLELATWEQIDQLQAMTRKINPVLRPFFLQRGITLVDFKLKFGLDQNQRLLADERTHYSKSTIGTNQCGKISQFVGSFNLAQV